MGITGILILVLCAVLILLILVQNTRGGGLVAKFASSNRFLSVPKTKNLLELLTWTLAVLLLLLCLFSNTN
jgi:preprotein translocase subunit SecG